MDVVYDGKFGRVINGLIYENGDLKVMWDVVLDCSSCYITYINQIKLVLINLQFHNVLFSSYIS